jgi:hypothetical protein
LRIILIFQRYGKDREYAGLMNASSFVFEFQELISNRETAFELDGKLCLLFDGFTDDKQLTGPDHYEVSGVMSRRPKRSLKPTLAASRNGTALCRG